MVLVPCGLGDRPEQDVRILLLLGEQLRVVVPDLVQTDERPPDDAFGRELEEIFIDKCLQDGVPCGGLVEVLDSVGPLAMMFREARAPA